MRSVCLAILFFAALHFAQIQGHADELNIVMLAGTPASNASKVSAPVSAPKSSPPAPVLAAPSPTSAPPSPAANNTKTPAASPPSSSPAPVSSPGPDSSPSPASGPAPASNTTKPKPGTTVNNGTLAPAQLYALQELGVVVESNPCAGSHMTMICDEATPYRHLIFLQLQYCSANQTLSSGALNNLTTLQALSFLDCPAKTTSLPPDLASSLTSFSCIDSLGRSAENPAAPGLSGVWLSKMHNLNQLIVRDVLVNVSSVGFILQNMTNLEQLTFSNTSLKGPLPKTWPANLGTVDLSLNYIDGPLPSFFGELQHVQSLDLTANNLTGRIPESIGRLRSLQKLAMGGNNLNGPIPVGAILNMTTLAYLDLSNNHLNGSIPKTLSYLTSLRYLDLRNNKLTGVLPFNTSFLSKLNTFRAGGNSQLCYNSSITSSKLITDLSQCDSLGNPISSEGPALSPDAYSPTSEPVKQSASSKHKGPKKVVWVVAIALGVIAIFIALVVIMSKWCRWKE